MDLQQMNNSTKCLAVNAFRGVVGLRGKMRNCGVTTLQGMLGAFNRPAFASDADFSQVKQGL
jgi:hypothetical protein